MTKKILNEYDDNRRMLNIIRNFKTPSKANLTERRHEYLEQNAMIGGRDSDYSGNEEQRSEFSNYQPDSNENGIDAINDVDVKLISNDPKDKILTDEQRTMISGLIDNFREQISQNVDFKPGFTFNVDEIRLDGVLPENDIKFTFITGENGGLYINAEMLNVNEQTIQMLNKLLTFNKQMTDGLELVLRQRKTNI